MQAQVLQFTLRRRLSWLWIGALFGAAPAALAAQNPQLPSPSQAQQLLQNPALVEQLRQRLQSSGLSAEQIRARLAASGYSPDLLDAYLGAASPGATVAVPGTRSEEHTS